MALLPGCSATSILNALTPRAGWSVTREIAYGEGPRQRLDVYRPDAADAAGGTDGAPVIVFFYGGNWQTGSRADYVFLAAALARRGFVTIVPDYRLYPDIEYPAFVEDSARAVAWARANASDHGGDRDALFLMGHSAGAYNAALVTFEERWLAPHGLDGRRDVAGFIGIAGPYDFLPLKDPALIAMFGGRERRDTQPIEYVDGGEPPAFLAVPGTDTVVSTANSARLAARLREEGVPVTEKSYAFTSHTTIAGAFAAPLRFIAPVADDVAAFVRDIASARGARGTGAAPTSREAAQ